MAGIDSTVLGKAGGGTVVPVKRPEEDYSTALLKEAAKQYPFISQYNPIVSVGKGDGYAETWPSDEPGDPSYPRPNEFPMGRVGVQVFRPKDFKASDLAAEFLHVDPTANATRERLIRSLTPEQLRKLKEESADYAESVRMGLTPQKALANAVDSAMRGYTTGQWPKEANDRMGYTPGQRKALDDLRRYMVTGKHGR